VAKNSAPWATADHPTRASFLVFCKKVHSIG
jgi:hypothetical protein